VLDRTIDQVPDPDGARTEPSLQLAGTPDGRGLDLGVLRQAGVRPVGRLRALAGTTAEFADDLGETMAAAQRRLDRFPAETAAYAPAGRPDRRAGIRVPAAPAAIDLRRAGVSSVVWATGYRPWYPWLNVPVLDADGRIRHRRGVTDVPGLYAMGLRFQYR